MQPDFEFSSWKVPARDLNKVSGSLYQAYDRNVFALHQLKRSSFLVSVGEDDAENLDPVIKISSFFFLFSLFSLVYHSHFVRPASFHPTSRMGAIQEVKRTHTSTLPKCPKHAILLLRSFLFFLLA
jgi:hypothetical protein